MWPSDHRAHRRRLRGAGGPGDGGGQLYPAGGRGEPGPGVGGRDRAGRAQAAELAGDNRAMADDLLFVYSSPGLVGLGEFTDWYDNEQVPSRLAGPRIGAAARVRAV